MTIKISYDECNSWTVEKLLYEGPSGYSQIAVHSNQRISCLFECGRIEYSERIVYCEFDIEWLTNGKDTIIKR